MLAGRVKNVELVVDGVAEEGVVDLIFLAF